MHPVYPEAEVETKKIQSTSGNNIFEKEIDDELYQHFITAWMPDKEDLIALNSGRPIYIKTLSKGFPRMVLYTLDENENRNF